MFGAGSDGVTLHVIEAGPEDGPLVILLHGFPEFWWGWRYQIAPLVEAGFRVVVPDQRGYNLSDKPQGRRAYDLDILAKDVIGLADAVGRTSFSLVGHDWGGLVAWWTASRYPERVAKLAILNAPHPTIAGAYMRRHPSQMLQKPLCRLLPDPAPARGHALGRQPSQPQGCAPAHEPPRHVLGAGYRPLRAGLVAARRAHGDAELVSRPAVQARHERSARLVLRRS